MILHPGSRSLPALVMVLLLALLGGCATNSPRDPLEPVNRVIYGFNDGVDSAIIRPVATGYRAVLPAPVRTGISNVFANVNDVVVSLNNLLQGKVVNAVSDVGRVLVNSTIGVAGIFDVATQFGLEKHNEDFGQTLGWWGIGDGPYLVLPLLGPSNLRDALARSVDYRADPITYVRSMRLRNSLWGVRALNQRADLLDTSKILETAALDPYEFLRDAYLQRRRSLVYDGAPPREKDDDADLGGTPAAKGPVSPRGATDDAAPAGKTLLPSVNADSLTPARAAAQEAPASPPAQPVAMETAPAAVPAAAPTPAAVTAPASEPQAEAELPAEPTAAQPQRVARVWTAASN